MEYIMEYICKYKHKLDYVGYNFKKHFDIMDNCCKYKYIVDYISINIS